MATQKELMNALTECIKTEETAIALYTQYDGNDEFLAEVDEKKKKRIRDVLKALKTGSDSHKSFFENVLLTIRTSFRNIF